MGEFSPSSKFSHGRKFSLHGKFSPSALQGMGSRATPTDHARIKAHEASYRVRLYVDNIRLAFSPQLARHLRPAARVVALPAVAAIGCYFPSGLYTTLPDPTAPPPPFPARPVAVCAKRLVAGSVHSKELFPALVRAEPARASSPHAASSRTLASSRPMREVLATGSASDGHTNTGHRADARSSPSASRNRRTSSSSDSGPHSSRSCRATCLRHTRCTSTFASSSKHHTSLPWTQPYRM